LEPEADDVSTAGRESVDEELHVLLIDGWIVNDYGRAALEPRRLGERVGPRVEVRRNPDRGIVCFGTGFDLDCWRLRETDELIRSPHRREF